MFFCFVCVQNRIVCIVEDHVSGCLMAILIMDACFLLCCKAECVLSSMYIITDIARQVNNGSTFFFQCNVEIRPFSVMPDRV